MPPLQSPCPEGCGGTLKTPTHKTCGSRSCQNKRQRRIARARKAGGQQSPYPPEVQAIQQAAKRDAKDAAAEVLRDELRPVVREALTADVLHSLQGMVNLVPAAIEALQADLDHGDAVTRQRAYELILRYTLGHKSIAPPPVDQTPSPMTVIINTPGSGSTGPADVPELDPPDEPIKLRECMECNGHKPVDEFVADSDRCQECHDEKMAEIEARFGRQ